MPAPATIAASGYFAAQRGAAHVGEAILRMKTATQGILSLGGIEWKITANVATKKLRGSTTGSSLMLTITSRNRLTGSVDGDSLILTRLVLRPISASEMAQSDAGPSGALKTVMDGTPDYKTEVGDSDTFWYAFGPVFYRGRLDGTARVLGIASDPGPTECLPFGRRALIGDSGQKTQGFLSKLGLTRSYVLVNGFAVALRPSKKTKGLKVLRTNAAIRAGRHALYNALFASGGIEAIVAFGEVAHEAYDLWAASNPAVSAVPHVKIAHPAAVDRDGTGNDPALKGWAVAITKLRTKVTPDSDGVVSGSNFGAYFTEADYARIPRWDLPAVAPVYLGDDSWGRNAAPRHGNCCARPSPDDSVSLLLTPPTGQGVFLRYRYRDGVLQGAKGKNNKRVVVDSFGIPT